MAEAETLVTIQMLSETMHEMRVPCEQLHRRLEFELAEMTRYEVVGDVGETLGQLMSDFEAFLRTHNDRSIVQRAMKRREMVKALGDLNERIHDLAREVRQRRPVYTVTSPVRSPVNSSTRSPVACSPVPKPLRPTVDNVVRKLQEIKQHVETLVRGPTYHKNISLRAIKQIANDPIYRTAVASAGAIWPLVELLEAGSNDQKEVVLAILLDLVCDRPAARRAIIEIGGIDPFVDLAAGDIERQKALASRLLSMLSKVYKLALEEGKDIRAEELKASCRETYLDITPSRAYHFAQLVGDTQALSTARAAGKAFEFAVFVKLLRDGTEAQQKKALNALKHIARNDFYDGVDLVAAGADVALAKLAADGTETQRQTAAGSLMVLCNSSSTRLVRLLHYEAPLFELPMIGTTDQIEIAVLAVRFFSWEDDDYHSRRLKNEMVIDVDSDDPINHKALAMVCGISAFVVRIRVGSGEQKEAAAKVLYELAYQESVYMDAMVDAGAIEALVVLARDGTQAQKMSALKTISRIVRDERNHLSRVGAAGGVSVVIQRTRDGTSGQKETALKILELVTQSENQQAAVVSAGGISVLLEVLQSGSSKQKTIALAILHDLAQGTSEVKRGIVQAGGVAPLVDLSRNGNAKQKAESLETLHHLAHGEKRNAMAIVAAGGTGERWNFFVDGWKSKSSKPTH